MKNIFKYTFLTLMLTAFIGCETGDLDLLNDPNNLTEESADPNFILNDVQITFRNIFSGYNGPSQTITRMTNQFGAYSGPVNDGTLSFEWSQSYQMFTNIDNLQAIHESSEDGIANLLGVAQIFEAFSYILLVDYLGDVPYDEANQPEEFPNPKVTLGATVYAKQLELLDEAIPNLQSGSTINPSTDLYFGEFDKDKWIAVANTLKLRVYNNLRLTQPAQATEGIIKY
ncbi:MAG: SusD/RagB family nutrient-binding outer membrane lipoprotein [Flavobacteriaceae bacterium]|nr:SusD/RagB family nutrient-binding outer membrane lipoprotein [Flavobacteriaceae bacterium]